MNTENIPSVLKSKEQWVCYNAVPDNDKMKKLIISPVTGKFAKCNNPKDWTTFSDALYYCKKRRMTGLVFTLTGNITFIDLDNAVGEEGNISDFGKKILDMFPNTYSELSVSGRGIHILAYGKLPKESLKRNDRLGIEMYDNNRFICITGNTINKVRDLADYTENIQLVNQMYLPRPIIQKRIYNNILSEKSDEKIVQLIKNSRQGHKFSMLYNGLISGYESHSNADYALVNILAFWTQDAAQIDRIFRASGLYRDKWDRGLGGATYGEVTIENALKNISVKFSTKFKDMEL